MGLQISRPRMLQSAFIPVNKDFHYRKCREAYRVGILDLALKLEFILSNDGDYSLPGYHALVLFFRENIGEGFHSTLHAAAKKVHVLRLHDMSEWILSGFLAPQTLYPPMAFDNDAVSSQPVQLGN